LSLLGEPAPGFSDPLAMLRACHGRMLDLCDLLERLPAWIEEHGIDGEADAAIDRVTRYFDTAAPLHHADEEQDLFPLLAGQASLDPVITQLRDEHQDLEAAWLRLSDTLAAIRSDQRLDPGLNAGRLQQSVDAFTSAYRRHIEIENGQLLPAAESALDQRQLAGLGQRLAARRGIAHPDQQHRED
jgi:hemerythrin-like domain-containing protein